MQFNINDRVRVKLTDHGRQLHRKAHEAFWSQPGLGSIRRSQYEAPKEDAEGWSVWQMWSLMETFGKHCGLAKPLPFETTIEIL